MLTLFGLISPTPACPDEGSTSRLVPPHPGRLERDTASDAVHNLASYVVTFTVASCSGLT